MNIVLINFDAVINSFGGTARVFANMANSLSARGHCVSGLFYDLKSGEPAFKIDNRVNLQNCCSGWYEKIFHNENLAKLRTFYISNRKTRRIKRTILELKSKRAAIQKALDKIKPDVIVVFQQEIAYLLVEMIKVKQPVVVMIHNKPTYYFERPEFEIYRPALNKCAYIQVLMPQYVQEAEKYLGKDKIVYIPNVVQEFPDYKGERKNIILNVAKIANRKRQHLIVEAFAKIEKNYPDWSVELWGFDQTDYAQKLRKRIEDLGLSSKIKLCGETKQVIEKLQQASIFAFPSEYEGFSLALSEAMSMGLAVIGCRDCVSVSALIDDGKTGLISDGDADDLAVKLELLIKNSQLRSELGARAKISMKEFSPEVVWGKWENLLNSMKPH